jgi:segregation and condensation protein B
MSDDPEKAATGPAPEAAVPEPPVAQEAVSEGPRAEEPGPEGLGPEGLGPEGLGPEGLGPEGLGPEGLGPEGLGPEGLGPEGSEAEEPPAQVTGLEGPGLEQAEQEGALSDEVRAGNVAAVPSQAVEPAEGMDQSAAADQPVEVEPARTAVREPDEDSLRLAEALVFASAEPVTPRGLARVLADDIDADAVLAALRARYAGQGVELVDAGNGVMFRSALDLAPRLRKVIESPRRLPRVAMETLAIVAYHQPMTRPEIEHIRGTALSQQTLDALLELNLIAPKGRRETPGRPTLWGTTPEFLAHFGLKDLRELPRREDLLLDTAPPKPVAEVLPADLQTPPEPGPK